MVVTHKQMKAKKATKIYVKEDNLKRKFMSKDEALEDNRMLRENRLKIARYAESLKAPKKDDAVEAVPTGDAQIEAANVQTKRDSEPSPNENKIVKLEKQLAEEKGPGSKARKEALIKKIKELKGEV